MRNKRTWIIGGIIAVVVGFFVINSAIKATKQKYVTAPAKKGTLVEAFVVSGNVSPGAEASLYSPLNGIVTSVFVKNGQQVNKGDKLVSLTSTATNQEKAAAYANYASALNSVKVAEQNKLVLQTQLEDARRQTINAQNDYDAMINRLTNPSTKQAYTQPEQSAFTSQITSAQENFKAVEKKYLDADTAIAAAKALLSSTWQTYQGYQDTTITAPTSGTISNLMVNPGDSVNARLSAAGGATSGTNPLIYIINDSGFHVDVQLNESDVVKSMEGDSAEILFDALPGVIAKGKVSHIDTIGTNTQGIVTYNAIIVLTNPDKKLRPGLTSYVTIQTGRVPNAIIVPSVAVVPYQGSDAVRIVDSPNAKKFTYRPVVVGAKGVTETQITKGLEPGELVVLEEKK